MNPKDEVLSTLDYLEGDGSAWLDDRAARQEAVTYYDLLRTGNVREGATPEGFLGFANQLFSREIQKGIGQPLKGGKIKAGQRLTQIYEDDDDVMLEFEVLAQDPQTGAITEYSAPGTQNRSDDDADEILRIPKTEVLKRFGAGAAMASGMDKALAEDPQTSRRQIAAMLREQYTRSQPAPTPQAGLDDVEV